jgi:hypothetical protein
MLMSVVTQQCYAEPNLWFFTVPQTHQFCGETLCNLGFKANRHVYGKLSLEMLNWTNGVGPLRLVSELELLEKVYY